jgi:predicted RNA-binding Zn-ribbon protein involved in translation (DUF1610 family)
MPRCYRKYSHVTNAMKDAGVARGRESLTHEGYTSCPKCGLLVKTTEIVDGVFPVHYLIGKIPCGWNEPKKNTTVCSGCGHSLDENWHYCPECGEIRQPQ